MRYLDPESLSKIKNLRFVPVRGLAEGAYSGMHRSAYKGSSQEFMEHREYVPGDEIKYIDWKVYARKERFFVRLYREEKNLRSYFLLDASGSMAYKSPRASRPAKFEYACRLAMGMAYLILRQTDSVGLGVFSDAPKLFLAPDNQMAQLERLDQALAGVVPQGKTDMEGGLSYYAQLLHRRSLAVIFSDLMGPAEKIQAVIRALKAHKHEVLVFHVLDPLERDFDFEGPVLFDPLEGGEPLRCDAHLLKEAYRREFAELIKYYTASFHSSEIGYATVYTDQPWEGALKVALGKQ